MDKETHDKIKASGAKTAHEAGIKFGHAELKQGHNVLHTYEPKKLAASENIHKLEQLEKGAIKNIITAGAMAGALATSHAAQGPTNSPLSYSHDKMLNAISQVESSGGKNVNHKPTSQGSAYGKFALMPNTIHETIKMNPDLKRQHSKAIGLNGNDLSHYMQDNPNLEQVLADRHIKRLEHHFGQNPTAIAFAYNQGISGTNRAIKEKQNIESHPYVQKFKQAYGKEK